MADDHSDVAIDMEPEEQREAVTESDSLKRLFSNVSVMHTVVSYLDVSQTVCI